MTLGGTHAMLQAPGIRESVVPKEKAHTTRVLPEDRGLGTRAHS